MHEIDTFRLLGCCYVSSEYMQCTELTPGAANIPPLLRLRGAHLLNVRRSLTTNVPHVLA